MAEKSEQWWLSDDIKHLEEKGHPFPHGKYFGGVNDGVQWAGKFNHLHGDMWEFVFIDEYDMPTSINGRGDSPLEAFSRCVKHWVMANGGAYSETLRTILPLLLGYFKPDGSITFEAHSAIGLDRPLATYEEDDNANII